MLDSSVVAEQYEQWLYPKPIENLDAYFATGLMDAGMPCMMHWLYWPDGWYQFEKEENIKILVAGCGSNLAAKYAYKHPKATVVGVDLSKASLEHEEKLKKQHNLNNLTLHQMNLEDLATLDEQFDFIDCAGVLHHLPEPEKGLNALKSVLNPKHGVMHILVYGLYGRMGLYMLQDCFRLMGLEQTEVDVEVVKKTLLNLPSAHPVLPFLHNNNDVEYDAGLVDMFLHKIDRGYSVMDCLQLMASCDLAFQGWFDNFDYTPESCIGDQQVFDQMAAIPIPERWQAVELFKGNISKHSFILTHSDRNVADFDINFSSDDCLNYVPIKRFHQLTPAEGDKPATVHRQPHSPIPLNDLQYQVTAQINNSNTIKDCIEQSGIEVSEEEKVTMGKIIFQSLWNLSMVMFYHNSK